MQRQLLNTVTNKILRKINIIEELKSIKAQMKEPGITLADLEFLRKRVQELSHKLDDSEI